MLLASIGDQDDYSFITFSWNAARIMLASVTPRNRSTFRSRRWRGKVLSHGSRRTLSRRRHRLGGPPAGSTSAISTSAIPRAGTILGPPGGVMALSTAVSTREVHRKACGVALSAAVHLALLAVIMMGGSQYGIDAGDAPTSNSCCWKLPMRINGTAPTCRRSRRSADELRAKTRSTTPWRG